MIDDWGEFLTQLRRGMIAAVGGDPLFPWPGPPPGLEGVPSASYMGEDACMRRAWFALISRVDGERAEYEALPRDGSLEIAPQRGWALEDTLRAWVSRARFVYQGKEYRLLVHHMDDAVVDSDKQFYGHPDDWAEIVADGSEVHERVLLEYKHQRIMAYMSFLRVGVAEAEALYYNQVQVLMAAGGFDKALFVITPFDISGVKGDLTRGRKRKDYSGELDQDFRMIPKSSGIDPAFYLEMIPANPAYQRQLKAWAKKLIGHVGTRVAPDRLYDVAKSWQCTPYCPWLTACQVVGPCKAECDHRSCNINEPNPNEDDTEYRPRG